MTSGLELVGIRDRGEPVHTKVVMYITSFSLQIDYKIYRKNLNWNTLSADSNSIWLTLADILADPLKKLTLADFG